MLSAFIYDSYKLLILLYSEKMCERLYYRAAYRAKECTISVYLKVSVCAVRDYLYYASNGLSLARTNQR